MNFWLKMNFQDNLNYFSQYLNFFHDLNLLILLILMSFIFFFLMIILLNKYYKMYFLEMETIEIIWTFFPCLILIFIGWPSMQLLYNLDMTYFMNNLTLKIMGHQWYWSYDYKNFFNIEFDSFMVLENDLSMGDFRLLKTNNNVVLPMNNNIRLLISSSDVLHSWALPNMGVKMDANPGRLNQTYMLSLFPGSYYGQCSELCGVNHSFMPINVEFTSLSLFKNWLMTMSFM